MAPIILKAMDLEEVKNFIRIELDVTVDDDLIVQLISATTAHAEKRLNCTLEKLKEENGGDIPADVNAWMMAHVATMYANREHISYAKMNKVEMWDRIIELHVKY